MIAELETVNTDKDEVILVNEFDRSVGLMSKMEAHEKGVLHRAFFRFCDESLWRNNASAACFE